MNRFSGEISFRVTLLGEIIYRGYNGFGGAYRGLAPHAQNGQPQIFSRGQKILIKVTFQNVLYYNLSNNNFLNWFVN